MDRQEVKGTAQQEYGNKNRLQRVTGWDGARLEQSAKPDKGVQIAFCGWQGTLFGNGETNTSHFLKKCQLLLISLLDLWEMRLLKTGHRRVKPQCFSNTHDLLFLAAPSSLSPQEMIRS